LIGFLNNVVFLKNSSENSEEFLDVYMEPSTGVVPPG